MSYEALGARIRSARQAAGMSREALAVASGVSFATVARTETATHEPTVSTLEALAAALGTTVGALLGDDEPEKAAS